MRQRQPIALGHAHAHQLAAPRHQRQQQLLEAPPGYTDIPGFCKSATLDEIRKHGHVLTPGRYVGAEAQDEDDEAFDEKMRRLTAQLAEQMARGAELDAVIREKLKGLGYKLPM
jgi:type I restriction enzyme M protein